MTKDGIVIDEQVHLGGIGVDVFIMVRRVVIRVDGHPPYGEWCLHDVVNEGVLMSVPCSIYCYCVCVGLIAIAVVDVGIFVVAMAIFLSGWHLL